MLLPSKPLVLSLVLLTGCLFGSKEVEGECTDGADNDQNGRLDCLDPSCAASPDCELYTTDPTLGTTTTWTETGDSFPTSVSTLTLGLYIGTNTQGRTTSIDWSGYNQPSMLVLNYGLAAWTGDLTQTDQYCTVTFFLDDRPNAVVANSEYWFGINGLDLNDAVSDCEALDPNYSTDYITDFGSGNWEIYIGGTVHPDIASNYDLNEWYGGLIISDVLGASLTIAMQSLETMNGSVVVNPDGSDNVIPAAQVQSANGVVSGLHIGSVPWIIFF